MNRFSKLFGALAVLAVTVTGCARELSSNVYTSSSTSGKVLEGKVLSARPVTIKDADKLEDNTMGMVAGGLLGAIAGSSVGGGTGKGMAAVGAGGLGAVAGAMIQDKLSTSQGMEYVVRIDKKYIGSVPGHTIKKKNTYGVNSASEDVSESIQVADTKTDLVSVIQGADIVFQPGQRVLIIYSNDRPRLAAAN